MHTILYGYIVDQKITIISVAQLLMGCVMKFLYFCVTYFPVLLCVVFVLPFKPSFPMNEGLRAFLYVSPFFRNTFCLVSIKFNKRHVSRCSFHVCFMKIG